METETVEFILSALETLLEASDVLQEGVEELQTEEDPRPFLTTPLDEYNVTEGLLLCILLCLFFKCLVRIVKEGFYWLL